MSFLVTHHFPAFRNCLQLSDGRTADLSGTRSIERCANVSQDTGAADFADRTAALAREV